ncbi:ABC transporter ATP-binding protein [Microbacterium marinilacus]|uniref:ABC transporter ATP-binding protein n=1 Tax=Microbacterium marinilacus TaxID=415209 RepID=A0ABP7BWG4_9MICO|nr:ABC transporter ATP-binding protein [Microbacterium marinilacus]MBY0688277.1 ABC transporter ATP-binding protein [Microbacterium marinilacus]
MADNPGIAVRGVRRSFGDVNAVSDATFEAPAGRVTALVGPNGSGKTTLLLMLASLLRPDAGSIAIAGADPVSSPAVVRSRVGWMPDALGAWPSLTARETLAVTGRLYRLSAQRAAARAAELLAVVGLTDLADRPARVLSRGQKQRLGLARALVHDPAVLLLDEPASGLDPQARIELRSLLRSLAAGGRTVLVSSHVLSELEEIADDAVFMVRGTVVSEGDVARASAGERDWRIRLLPGQGDPAGNREIVVLLATAGVNTAALRRDRGDLVAPFPSDEAAAAALSAMVTAGLRITEFAPVAGRLEQTFLGLSAPEGHAS